MLLPGQRIVITSERKVVAYITDDKSLFVETDANEDLHMHLEWDEGCEPRRREITYEVIEEGRVIGGRIKADFHQAPPPTTDIPAFGVMETTYSPENQCGPKTLLALAGYHPTSHPEMTLGFDTTMPLT